MRKIGKGDGHNGKIGRNERRPIEIRERRNNVQLTLFIVRAELVKALGGVIRSSPHISSVRMTT